MPGADERSEGPGDTNFPPRLVLMVGPDKAGSSWLHELARWHTEVSVPTAKDLFFWDMNHHRGIAWYLRQFRPSVGSAAFFEAGHDYLYSKEVPGRLYSSGIDAHVIVVLRDPLDRALSAYLYMVRQGRLRNTSFSDALRAVPELIDHGRYAHYSQRFMEVIGRGRVHFLDFELVKNRPSRAAAWFFRRLDVEVPEAVPEPMLQPARVASRARIQPLATVGKRVAVLLRHRGFHSMVGRLKRNALVERVLFERVEAAERPRPTAADVAYARTWLEADVHRLDEMVGGRFAGKWFRG